VTQTRPRALFVGINYRYINPTHGLIPTLFGRALETRFYGPGFVSQAVLDRGIASYVDSLDGVDVIIATKDLCANHDAERLSRFLHRYAVMLNGGQVTRNSLTDIRSFLKANRRRAICPLTDVDPHSAPQADLDNFRAHAEHFMLWGNQFLNTLGDEALVAQEWYLQRKLRAGHALGLLDRFAAEESTRIVSLGMFVSESEFHWGGLVDRPYDVSVPGSSYIRRKQLISALARNGNFRMPRNFYRPFYQIAERLGLRPYARFQLLNLYNHLFHRSLCQSKSCITDGGANNYPVRKFFEIPAAGALMLCAPATGMDALGFCDRMQYFAAPDASATEEILHDLTQNVERYEPIADAGRRLVFEKHSLAARAEQLRRAIARILEGTFRGSRWDNGEFVCI
jgi:hypothetical protein